jgi:hypothetical protein
MRSLGVSGLAGSSSDRLLGIPAHEVDDPNVLPAGKLGIYASRRKLLPNMTFLARGDSLSNGMR